MCLPVDRGYARGSFPNTGPGSEPRPEPEGLYPSAGPWPRFAEMDDSQQIAHMKFVYGDDHAELDALLSESVAPRPPDFLFHLASPLLTPDSRLLDVGCRDARHLIPLVMRSGCTGVGIDPVERNIDRARAAVTAADLDRRIEIRTGVMAQTDESDGSVDVVWCRDMLEVIPDLQAGLSEVAPRAEAGRLSGHLHRVCDAAAGTPRSCCGESAPRERAAESRTSLGRRSL
jgi:hypothetical protein